ncbi:hypothetical protein MLD38_024915 [Melastoma candidum]|uniref:Uncharacterized protein n=1 Tax=Melastoma candidum TaxID=119954 RepID=A0ACB9NWT4_9MYRT|nr:hypothetical protein MLD38_024915 [Melastoma candidum]
MEFRRRSYKKEEELGGDLPRSRVNVHPLSPCSDSSYHSQFHEAVDNSVEEFFDPLRGTSTGVVGVSCDSDNVEFNSSIKVNNHDPLRDWTMFKKFLMQRFPVSKLVRISTISDGILRSHKYNDKSSTSLHPEEADDSKNFADADTRYTTRQEYVSRLIDFKEKLRQAWQSDDRVASLKIAIKRIKEKAELSEDGIMLRPLPENFVASDVCSDAKETCYNWLSKIGSVKELLPRIYLELAVFPCWRFLLNQPMDSFKRIGKMMRGLTDPLSSSYCRLYMAYTASKFTSHDTEILITCIKDMMFVLEHAILNNSREYYGDRKKLLMSLMEPTIGYIMRNIFKSASQEHLDNILVEFDLNSKGRIVPCASIFIHYLIKELPDEALNTKSMEIVDLIGRYNDGNFDQCINYRLLGFRLCESASPANTVHVVNTVFQVVSQWDELEKYLNVVDPYVDLVLQNHMDDLLMRMVKGISERAEGRGFSEVELGDLQSILLKLLSHFKDPGAHLFMTHCLELLDMMYGSFRSTINLQILNTATRNGAIRDPVIIQLLLEICLAVIDSLDQANISNDEQMTRLISRFINLVDYNFEMEHHLAFLVRCRKELGGSNETKEALVHASNKLVIRGLKDGKHPDFIKSCMAFNEVTIPAVSNMLKQLNLYIETAEVAILGGLISHMDRLIQSVVSCLKIIMLEGPGGTYNVDIFLSAFQKASNLLVMSPSNPEVNTLQNLQSFLELIESGAWMMPMIRFRSLSTILWLAAIHSQEVLPYHIKGSQLAFEGDVSMLYGLLSFSETIVQKLLDSVQEEPSKATHGGMALDACNCIASVFEINNEVSNICYDLLKTAKVCLGSSNKYVKSTGKFLERRTLGSSVVTTTN